MGQTYEGVPCSLNNLYAVRVTAHLASSYPWDFAQQVMQYIPMARCERSDEEDEDEILHQDNIFMTIFIILPLKKLNQ